MVTIAGFGAREKGSQGAQKGKAWLKKVVLSSFQPSVGFFLAALKIQSDEVAPGTALSLTLKC